MPDLSPADRRHLEAAAAITCYSLVSVRPEAIAAALAALDEARRERDEVQRRWQAVALKSTDMATTMTEISDLFRQYLGHRVMDETDDDCPHTQLVAQIVNLVNAARVKENQARERILARENRK